MRVEFTIPMEGPRTAAHPKGVSRRPGQTETVDDAEGARLIERGMAIAVDGDGFPVRITTAEHQARQAAASAAVVSHDSGEAGGGDADVVETEDEGEDDGAGGKVEAADRQAPVERAVSTPGKPVERAVTQPTPARPGAPKGAAGGKATAKA
jgi:hypothetical protein